MHDALPRNSCLLPYSLFLYSQRSSVPLITPLVLSSLFPCPSVPSSPSKPPLLTRPICLSLLSPYSSLLSLLPLLPHPYIYLFPVFIHLSPFFKFKATSLHTPSYPSFPQFSYPNANPSRCKITLLKASGILSSIFSFTFLSSLLPPLQQFPSVGHWVLRGGWRHRDLS